VDFIDGCRRWLAAIVGRAVEENAADGCLEGLVEELARLPTFGTCASERRARAQLLQNRLRIPPGIGGSRLIFGLPRTHNRICPKTASSSSRWPGFLNNTGRKRCCSTRWTMRN
jgi:hypothetical protein